MEKFLMELFDCYSLAVVEANEAYQVADNRLDALCGKEGFAEAFSQMERLRSRRDQARANEKYCLERVASYKDGDNMSDLFYVEMLQ
jgi:hypothetical protein